ncbi:FAD-dependent oxidoreductase [candidate division KSB1 bacterium]|nr:FAD-dependent oxidoreductase [candidate division KSB1 bacterium]
MKKDKFITDFEDIPKPRQKMPHLSLEERKLNFNEVELGFTEEIALRETSRCLSCRRCIGCGLCLAECDQQAIVYDQKEEYTTVAVDSVVVATGVESFDARRKPEFGYSYYPNVITNIELERILNASGPYGGILMRPSDGEIPKRIAFIQCVGSRDEDLGVNYCSNICCSVMLKQAIAMADTIDGITISVFYSDIRPYVKDSETQYLNARDKYGIQFIAAKVTQVQENSESDSLVLKYSQNGKEEIAEFDLVVLSTGINPSVGLKRLSRQVGSRLNKYGFFPGSEQMPIASPGDDVWFAGSVTHPTDVTNSLIQASAVAARVLQSFNKKQLLFETDSEPKIKIKEKKVGNRIGVFFCRYGMNSQFNIDPDDVVRFISNLEKDIYVAELEFGCNTTGKQKILDAIDHENLGKVIIAPCYQQQKHIAMFQQLVQAGGLPGDSLSMLSIEQGNGRANTEDIKGQLVKLIESGQQLESFTKNVQGLIPECAIIGNSISAWQAAQDIAELGFKTHLILPSSEHETNEREIFWHNDSLEDIVKKLNENVASNSNIIIHKESAVTGLSSNPGNYELIFNENGVEKSISVSGIVVAPGGEPYQPTEFFYGNNQNVLTQKELHDIIAAGNFNFEKVVMIQCVGSRQPDRQYCSQICCEQAIKNALKIKAIKADASITILHRDIRVYDFEEDNYSEALEKGINFIRMDQPPEIKMKDQKFDIHVIDRHTGKPVQLESDLLVLSNGIVQHRHSKNIADVLKLSIDQNGFFSEDDNLLNPLQTNQTGIFIAGLAHSPQRLSDALVQASAAAGKIGLMFSMKNHIE